MISTWQHGTTSKKMSCFGPASNCCVRQDLVFSFRIMNGVLMARPVLKSSIPKLLLPVSIFSNFLLMGQYLLLLAVLLIKHTRYMVYPCGWFRSNYPAYKPATRLGCRSIGVVIQHWKRPGLRIYSPSIVKLQAAGRDCATGT